MKTKYAALFTAAFVAQTLLFGTAVQVAAESAGAGAEPAVEATEPAVAAGLSSGTVTVAGRASVYSVPDKAILTLRVQTTEDTAETAQSQNSAAANAVVDALKESGIDEKSIRTTDYNLYPQYDYERSEEDGEAGITGYVCSSQIEIKDLDADHVGKIISTAVAAGANGVDSVDFRCSDYEERYDEALKAALEAARHTAEVLADAAGQTVGAAVSIEEGYQSSELQYQSRTYMDAAVSEDAAENDSIIFTPGESEIEANVTVTYVIS